ncbi:conserved hypothetical protein [Burkholderia pseudomallei 576]|uniref:Uncharacterized protein n=1 Tax=Burkholderia pseudomallei (strain 1106a) TaxID=357348 RepID=A3NPT5_BURP0|nr:hypothetical protein BURPS1106A_0071 [Burkholderia pseudomallei 1106a]EEC33061.1 conserved hypothetical protein [Burkholderia pseudomallei 576]
MRRAGHRGGAERQAESHGSLRRARANAERLVEPRLRPRSSAASRRRTG